MNQIDSSPEVWGRPVQTQVQLCPAFEVPARDKHEAEVQLEHLYLYIKPTVVIRLAWLNDGDEHHSSFRRAGGSAEGFIAYAKSPGGVCVCVEGCIRAGVRGCIGIDSRAGVVLVKYEQHFGFLLQSLLIHLFMS